MFWQHVSWAATIRVAVLPATCRDGDGVGSCAIVEAQGLQCAAKELHSCGERGECVNVPVFWMKGLCASGSARTLQWPWSPCETSWRRAACRKQAWLGVVRPRGRLYGMVGTVGAPPAVHAGFDARATHSSPPIL